MKDPTRRNRNIGTPKQGHGHNNTLLIPEPALISKRFYERLNKYVKYFKKIQGHEFLFVIENTRTTPKHACTINDIAKILENVPKDDFGDLKLIIFRQPKRKEEILSPVWGRLIYSYQLENEFYPAIIIEAINMDRKLNWSKKLSVESQKELERLRKDGHNIIEDKRNFTADYQIENVRNTQLYRTFLHEIGHYVHYLQYVEKPANENEEYENWEKQFDTYIKIPKSEREVFANRYSEKLRNYLLENNIIPFERIEDN